MTKKNIKTPKKINYLGSSNKLEYNETFYKNFEYNYWYHKCNALYEYVKFPKKIKKDIMFPNDTTNEKYILENFKMEIHMTVFHSTETLFLVIFAHLYLPNLFPIWITHCTSTELFNQIKKVADNGLDSILTNANDWLLGLIYPFAKPTDRGFSGLNNSIKYIKNYLQNSAKEYVDHVEYNSYKHGLRCFPGQFTMKIIGEQSQKTLLDSKSDSIFFYELEKHKAKKNTYQIKNSHKSYDVKRDANLIITNSMILENIFLIRKKGLESKGKVFSVRKNIFQGKNSSKLFAFKEGNKAKGIVTRFSHS